MAGISDTSPEARRILLDVYRRMPPGQKWLQLGQMYEDARALHAAGVRLRNPGATSRDVRASWLHVNLGFGMLDRISPSSKDSTMPNLSGVRDVIRVFTELGIVYALGGSMASSVHGIDRYTRDADITAEPFPGLEARFALAFGPDYYVSVPAVRQAIQTRSSCNIINTATGFKVDIFIRKDEPFERSALARRVAMQLPDAPEQPIVLHSAEDIILFKLRWYRLGNEVAQQQLADVVGVMQVQGEKLDNAYLDRWAPHLGVADLLARARQEVSP